MFVTRLRSEPVANNMSPAQLAECHMQPALKVCITTGLSKKEIEKAGVTIRHAVTKIMTRKSARQPSLTA